MWDYETMGGQQSICLWRPEDNLCHWLSLFPLVEIGLLLIDAIQNCLAIELLDLLLSPPLIFLWEEWDHRSMVLCPAFGEFSESILGLSTCVGEFSPLWYQPSSSRSSSKNISQMSLGIITIQYDFIITNSIWEGSFWGFKCDLGGCCLCYWTRTIILRFGYSSFISEFYRDYRAQSKRSWTWNI